MKDQNNTGEDYLDSLLNSILNNESAGSDSDDLGLFGDSVDKKEQSAEKEDFFEDIEDEFFGKAGDDLDFDNEITDDELFGLDDDIMSVIENAPQVKAEEKVNESEAVEAKVDDVSEGKDANVSNELNEFNEGLVTESEAVEEAIVANDSAVDDNLQGLLDVMGIDEQQEAELAIEKSDKKKRKKEKKKLFGRKKKKKAEKEDVAEGENNELVDLSSLSGLMGSSDIKADDAGGLDFSVMDMPAEDDNQGFKDGGFSAIGDLDFDMSEDDGFSDIPPSEPVSSGRSASFSFDDEEEEENVPKGKKGKKGKKEKKKKDKKAKAKKGNDKSGKKAAKPRKEKKVKEKEPDEIIHISKGFAFLAFTVVFVFVFAVIFGGDYYTYNKKISDATQEYVNKNYSDAYDLIFGLEMKKDDDKELFSQIQTVMFVNRHYEAYESLIRMDEYEQGLYSLLKGVKMFDKYQNDGRKLNCYDDMQDVLGWIDRGLLETYGLTESQARELNLLNNDDKLAMEVAVIAKEARQKAKAEKEAAEEAAKEAAKAEQSDTE